MATKKIENQADGGLGVLGEPRLVMIHPFGGEHIVPVNIVSVLLARKMQEGLLPR